MNYYGRNYARGGVIYRRGDIVYVEREIEETKGHEQLPGRPAVIVSGAAGDTCMVVYLTTNEARATDSTLHVRISTAARPSVALCDQIKTVDVRRLGSWYGHVTQAEAEEIDRAMLKALVMQDVRPAQTEEQRLQGLLLEARAEAKAWKEIALKFGGGHPVKVLEHERRKEKTKCCKKIDCTTWTAWKVSGRLRPAA